MTKRPLLFLAVAATLVVALASPSAARPKEFRILGGDICGEMGIYGTKPFSPILAYSDGPRISRVFFSGTSGPCGEFRFSLEITDRRGNDVSGTDDDAIDQGRVEISCPASPSGASRSPGRRSGMSASWVSSPAWGTPVESLATRSFWTQFSTRRREG